MNISNKKYEKLRNYSTKMTELDRFVLKKGLFTSVKGSIPFTKEHSDNPEG